MFLFNCTCVFCLYFAVIPSLDVLLVDNNILNKYDNQINSIMIFCIRVILFTCSMRIILWILRAMKAVYHSISSDNRRLSACLDQ